MMTHFSSQNIMFTKNNYTQIWKKKLEIESNELLCLVQIEWCKNMDSFISRIQKKKKGMNA